MDLLAEMIAELLTLLPALPAEVMAALNSFASMGSYLGGLIGKFGVIIPFSVINTAITWFIAACLFWVAVMGLRAVLWALGR